MKPEKKYYFFKKSIIKRDETSAYLIRWTLFGCPYFSIKIHHILLSDDDCLHDHPWFFVSFILKGGYYEHGDWGGNYTPRREWGIFKKWYGPGALLFRKAKWTHRLELPKDKTCWTFIITGKPIREWGFWTKKGWLQWEAYNKSNEKC